MAPSFEIKMTCKHHLEQAKNNEQAARSIRDSYPDWAVTMCFYAALHLVEYYACVNGIDIASQYPLSKSVHDSRRNYVIDFSYELRNKNLRKVYEDLEEESKVARYMKNIYINTEKYYNTKKYYTERKEKVTQSFQNLQQVKQILNID